MDTLRGGGAGAPTLRDGAAGMGGEMGVAGGIRTGGGMVGGELRPVRRTESWCSAATWLSVRGARGEPGEGC
jgi:hypothetical protein